MPLLDVGMPIDVHEELPVVDCMLVDYNIEAVVVVVVVGAAELLQIHYWMELQERHQIHQIMTLMSQEHMVCFQIPLVQQGRGLIQRAPRLLVQVLCGVINKKSWN